MNSSTKRSEIRNKLLKNGYKPLPLVDKGIRIPKWSTLDVDQEFLDKYARSANFPNTGIRCDNLIAFDIDVTDESLADDIEALIEAECGPTELCRVGQWPKRLLLYRISGEALKSARTGKFGADGHMVELLCGRGRQFAAFGKHPKTGRDYEWDGDSPLEVGVSQLPVLTFEQALNCLNEIEQFFVSKGIERTVRGGTRGPGGQQHYDLNDDLELLLTDGTVTTWGQLKGSLGKDGVWCNMRREDGEFGDSDAVHAFVAHGLDQPCLHDFPRDETHFDAVMNQALAVSLPAAPPSNIFSNNLEQLQQTFALIGDQTVVFRDNPSRVLSLAGWKALYSHMKTPAPTARNASAMKKTVDEWLEDGKTLRADAMEMRPDHRGEETFAEGAATVFNTYRPPELSSGGSLDVVFEFIAHLIPDPSERALFWDWHALKIAHPDWRLHGLVMVTEAFGTGRGTWSQILERLFGSSYVRDVPLHDLMGSNSQGAAYNEYMAQSLIVTIPEALELDVDRSKYQIRSAAYERLKYLCDPTAQTMHVKRKYGRNTHERIFASLVIASNHADALAIPADDRRLLILSNTKTPLVNAPNDLRGRIHTWKDQPGNVGDLALWLEKRALTAKYDPFALPPMTTAKQAMVDSGRSDLDLLFDHFLEQSAGDLCTHTQWRDFVSSARMQGDYDLPPAGTALERGINAVLQRNAKRLSQFKHGIKIKGTRVRPWVLRNINRWQLVEDTDLIRDEVLKNGDIHGGLVAH